MVGDSEKVIVLCGGGLGWMGSTVRYELADGWGVVLSSDHKRIVCTQLTHPI